MAPLALMCWAFIKPNSCSYRVQRLIMIIGVLAAGGTSFEGAHAAAATNNNLADSTIPPWLDAFGETPNITLTLIFNFNGTTRISQNQHNGKVLPLNQTSVQPHVQISGPSLDPNASYTLLSLDPDAFSPSNPLLRNVIHWIISNIPGSTLPSQDIADTGTIVLHYLIPTKPTHFPPPYGVHRYYNLLFKQVVPHQDIRNITTPLPSNFNTRNFTQMYNLGYPVAGTIFKVDLDA